MKKIILFSLLAVPLVHAMEEKITADLLTAEPLYKKYPLKNLQQIQKTTNNQFYCYLKK